MFFVVSDDLHSLTSKELDYIAKIVLMRKFENCIDIGLMTLWLRSHTSNTGLAELLYISMEAGPGVSMVD